MDIWPMSPKNKFENTEWTLSRKGVAVIMNLPLSRENNMQMDILTLS